MTLHGKHTHKSETRKQQRALRKHIHAKTNEKNDQEFRRHTHTLIDEPLYQRSVLAIHTHTCVCVRIVWAINLSGGDASHHRGHHFVEGGNNGNCTHSHTHTLKDALIKHGSKN